MTHPDILSIERTGYPDSYVDADGWCDKCDSPVFESTHHAEDLYSDKMICENCISDFCEETLEFVWWKIYNKPRSELENRLAVIERATYKKAYEAQRANVKSGLRMLCCKSCNRSYVVEKDFEIKKPCIYCTGDLFLSEVFGE